MEADFLLTTPAMPQQYSSLPGEVLPHSPPAYADDNSGTPGSRPNNDDDDSLSDLEANVNFQEFEIEDPEASMFDNRGESFFQRAGNITRSLRTSFKSKIVTPVYKIFDPVAGIWRTISIKFDAYLSKVGNPLIVKRFLYVFFISMVIYFIVSSGLYPTNIALPNGQFNDIEIINKFFKSHIDAKSMEETLEYLSSIPHISGTAGDLALARYVDDIYERSGMHPKEFNVVKSFINYPNVTKLLISSENLDLNYEALLVEYILEEKVDTSEYHNLPLKGFNFLSADGKVDGPIVYVNYGRDLDFQYLKSHNVNPEKAICVGKYGKISASSKLILATSYGCSAFVYFKDPNYLDLQDDLQKAMIEKQGVANLYYSSGDVLTPGWSSIESNPKLTWEKSQVSPSIPSLPVSYNAILPILKALKGHGVKVDSDWSWENLEVELWTGGSGENFQGHFEVETIKRDSKPLWNVVGKIGGTEQSEKAIIIGAQRDSACYGAVNPNTGTTVLLEMVKLFTGLQKKLNWKPLRSIYFISIDGSEYNNAGITEWIEERFREIRNEAYSYIDLSDAVSGQDLQIKTHPVFENVISEVLNEWQPDDHLPFADFQTPNEFKNYYPFQSFAGTPVTEIKFINKQKSEAYSSKYPENSCLDNFQRFKDERIDVDMEYHKKLVEIMSRFVIKMVDEPLIPYGLDSLFKKLGKYVEDAQEYCAAVSGDNEAHLDFSRISQANGFIEKIAEEFQIWKQTWSGIVNIENGGIEPSMLSVRRWEWNAKLIYFLRFAVSETGLADRPWIKNMIFAPQLAEPEFTNKNNQPFEWWTFPGIRDAIKAKNWGQAQSEIYKIAEQIKDASGAFIQSN